MRILKNINNRNGVTLIELIVTIAILSIVIVAITNLFIFNNRIYSRSENLSQVQFDVRMASDFITKELRNQITVSTLDTTLNNSIDLADLQSIYGSIKSVNFEIKKQDDNYFIFYSISGSDIHNNNQYNLETDILLNNVNSGIEGTGDTVYYE